MAELTYAEATERVRVQERELLRLKQEQSQLIAALERFAPITCKDLLARFKHERTG